jgi:hypothetical protein
MGFRALESTKGRGGTLLHGGLCHDLTSKTDVVCQAKRPADETAASASVGGKKARFRFCFWLFSSSSWLPKCGKLN